MSESDLMVIEDLQSRIYTIRGVQVMLDSDLAVCYGVDVKRLNEQVKRNIGRFPESFRFQLTGREMEALMPQISPSCDGKNLKSQFATSSWGAEPSTLHALLRFPGFISSPLRPSSWP